MLTIRTEIPYPTNPKMRITNGGHTITFARSQGGVEVDFFCETSDGFVAIEVKASERWEKRYNRGLNRMRKELGQNQVACYGVHPGKRLANWDGIPVMPTTDFLTRLWDGEILPV